MSLQDSNFKSKLLEPLNSTGCYKLVQRIIPTPTTLKLPPATLSFTPHGLPTDTVLRVPCATFLSPHHLPGAPLTAMLLEGLRLHHLAAVVTHNQIEVIMGGAVPEDGHVCNDRSLDHWG